MLVFEDDFMEIWTYLYVYWPLFFANLLHIIMR